MKKMMNKFFILISLMFYIITTTILIILNIEWYYFLYGLLLGVITHIIIIIQNRQLYNNISNSIYEIKPRRMVFIWFVLKAILIIIFTIILIFISKIYDNPNAIRIMFLYLIGYLSLKVIFIISLLIYERR